LCTRRRRRAEVWAELDVRINRPLANVTRSVAVAELGAGLWLALRQQPTTTAGRNEPLFGPNVVW
jgi:hypothetical protein